jgi:hypothetical protein
MHTNGLGANRTTKYLAAYAPSVIVKRRTSKQAVHGEVHNEAWLWRDWQGLAQTPMGGY